MTRSRTRRPAAVYTVLQAVTVMLALWLSKHFQVARLAATLVALAPTLPGAPSLLYMRTRWVLTEA
ncbi:hypothetical protein [Streptomyces sp. NPDC007074]|uniref:hypothetical protein n=1 Tax=Streptomyces sp. NPDC007074 TaxID=3156764 RepID=UPI0033FC7B09